MHRWVRTLLPLALLAVVLAGAVGLASAYWLERTLSPESVAARLGAALGREVRIGSLDVRFTPWLRVHLESVALGSEAAADVVEVGPRVLPLLLGRAEPARIEIAGAHLRLVRTAEGRIQFGEEMAPAAGAGGDPGAWQRWPPPEIHVADASVELIDRALGPEPVRTWLQLESVSLEPSLLKAGLELEGTARLGNAGDRGALRVAASFDAAGPSGDARFDLRALDLATLRPYLACCTDPRLQGNAEASARLTLRDHTLAVRDLLVTTTGSGLAPDGRGGLDLSIEAVDLKDLTLEADTGWPGLPARGELQNLSLSFGTPRGPASLHVGTGTLVSQPEGSGSRLTLEATLGPGPERDVAFVRASAVLDGDDASLASLPFELKLRTDAFDPQPLLPFLPSNWKARTRDARIAGEASLSGALGAGLGGEARLELRSGALEILGFELEGAGSLTGTLAIGEAGVSLDAGRIVAEQASVGPHVGSGVTARLRWTGDVLELAAIDLARYDGPLVLQGAGDAGGLELHVTRAKRLSAHGETGPWPLGDRAWLRVPSQASVADAEATLVDPRSARASPVPLHIREAELRGFGRGGTATFAVRASLGAPTGSLGRLELEGTLGPLGDASASLSIGVTARALDPSLLMAYARPDWRLAGEPGPLEATASVRVRPDGPLQADVSVPAETGTLAVGDVRLEAPLHGRANLEWREGGLSIRDGRLEAQGGVLQEYEAEALRADLNLDGQTLSLQPLRWRAYGGSWQQRGSVTFSDPPSFDLALEVEGADAAQLAGIEGTDSPTLLGGRAELHGTWNGVEQWLEGVEGKGTLELRGGTIPGSELLRAVWNALRSRVPGLRNWQRDAQPSRARLQRASLPFRVERRRVRTDALEVVTDDYTLTGEGLLSQDFDLRVNGELQFTALGVSKLLRVGGVPAGVRKGLRLPAIPIEARGPMREPAISAEVGKIPRATIGGILGLPSRAGEAAKGVGGALRGLGRRVLGPPEPEGEPREP